LVSLRLHKHAETVIGRVRGRRIRVILVSALLAMAVVTAGFPIYVAPQIDDLRHADAIFVLGGRGYERYSYGLALALRGVAPQLVVSNPAGAQDIWLTDLCEHQRYAFTVSCFKPEPDTTFGEARELRRLAIEQGWRTVIVVTFRPHISRARYIVEKCFDGDLIMSASPARLSFEYWMWMYVYQTAGYIRAAFQSAC
jgi:uncharacterized SAM-binding protein YcdF (DUF218 family)